MKSVNGNGRGVTFGAPDHVAAERALAEFRAGRPVVISGAGDAVVALPVDGLDAHRLAALEALCAPFTPQLIVTARRARSLGLDAAGPVVLALPEDRDPAAIHSLVADIRVYAGMEAEPAAPSASAAIELAKLAQRLPALLIAPCDVTHLALCNPPLAVVSADAISKFRRAAIQSLAIAGESKIPLYSGVETRFVVFRDAIGGGAVAVVVGKPDLTKAVPVRLHSACLTGDVFGSRRCDCGDQLRLALTRLENEGGGVILYLEQEGRGVGLANKIRAYALQDAGLDTVDANTTLGFDDDERDYGVAARMLQMLGCTRVLLLTNNPHKLDGLADAGIEVSGRKALHAPINAHNRRYLTAKAMRAGHKLDHLIAALADTGDGKGLAHSGEPTR
jgi:GTP cyclohydrolase II